VRIISRRRSRSQYLTQKEIKKRAGEIFAMPIKQTTKKDESMNKVIKVRHCTEKRNQAYFNEDKNRWTEYIQ
jgi:hypothetical protein